MVPRALIGTPFDVTGASNLSGCADQWPCVGVRVVFPARIEPRRKLSVMENDFPDSTMLCIWTQTGFSKLIQKCRAATLQERGMPCLKALNLDGSRTADGTDRTESAARADAHHVSRSPM